MNHVRVEIMREAGAGTDGEPCDDGKDRGEGDSANEGKEDVAAEMLGKERRRHVLIGNVRRLQQRGGAKTEERRHQVERADRDHRPDHAEPRGSRVGHGVKANEDVRQAGRPQDKRDAERNQIDSAQRAFEGKARLQEVLRDLRARLRVDPGDVTDRFKEATEAYEVLKLLRTAIVTKNDLEKLKKKGVEDIDDILKLLWENQMILVFRDDRNNEYYALLSDFLIKLIFPKYLLNVIKSEYEKKSKAEQVLIEYLNVLENTYIGLKSTEKSKKLVC